MQLSSSIALAVVFLSALVAAEALAPEYHGSPENYAKTVNDYKMSPGTGFGEYKKEHSGDKGKGGDKHKSGSHGSKGGKSGGKKDGKSGGKKGGKSGGKKGGKSGGKKGGKSGGGKKDGKSGGGKSAGKSKEGSKDKRSLCSRIVCDASAHLYPRDSLQHQCCGHLPSRTHIFAPSFERRDLDIWYTILAREADAKAEPEASAEACVDFYLEEREADAEAEASPELEEREADAEADDYLEFEEREADAEAEDDFSLGLEGREAEAEANLELEDWLYGTDSYDDFF